MFIDIKAGDGRQNSRAGGIGGMILESEINSCINEGSIVSGCDRIGGICADGAGTTFRNCSNKGTLEGLSNVRRYMWYR